MTHTYKITGMTCMSCVAKVKSELLKMTNVSSAEVQLESPQATVTMDSHISIQDLDTAIKKAGNKYTIKPIDQEMEVDPVATKNSYFPIFLIFAYITGISLIVQFTNGEFNAVQWMQHFMGGFFLVFSFFKIMNLKGFAEGYASYDVIAAKIPSYGLLYPFIELALGVSFLTGFEPFYTNLITLIVMGISTIGVAQSLIADKPFQCACLGTVIKLPLSKVTLFEDLLMVGMSAAMLLM